MINKDHQSKQLKYFNIYQPHLYTDLNNYNLKLASRVKNSLQLSPGQKILEVGAGAGRFSLPLKSLGVEVEALDFSEVLLDELKKKDPQIKVIRSDIDELDDKDKYDTVVGFYVLHHLENLEKSLASMFRVLKNGGEICFVEPNPNNLLYYIQPFVSKNMSWNEEKGFLKMRSDYLKTEFEKAGFTDFKITKFGFFPPFVVNTSLGLRLDNLLEKFPPFKPFLPFLLIRAGKG